jgi:hypothetical protein
VLQHLLLFFELKEIRKDLNIDHLVLQLIVVELILLKPLVLQDLVKFVGLVLHILLHLHLVHKVVMLVLLVHKVLLVVC